MLDIIALGFLVFTFVSLCFGAIAIAVIPGRLAAERHHPQRDAIRFAGWLSLFTLHAIWPLVWMWAVAWRQETMPHFAEIDEDTAINDKPVTERADATVDGFDEDITDSVTLLRHRYEVLDDRIDRIEKAIMAASDAA